MCWDFKHQTDKTMSLGAGGNLLPPWWRAHPWGMESTKTGRLLAQISIHRGWRPSLWRKCLGPTAWPGTLHRFSLTTLQWSRERCERTKKKRERWEEKRKGKEERGRREEEEEESQAQGLLSSTSSPYSMCHSLHKLGTGRTPVGSLCCDLSRGPGSTSVTAQ